MPTPFASLEARVNAVTLAKTANATVVIGGVEVNGVFENGYGQTQYGVGMASTAPTFTLPTSSVPDDPIGIALAINGANYTIEAHEPDGTGMSVLTMEEAP